MLGYPLSSDQHVLKCVAAYVSEAGVGADDIITNHWNNFPPPVFTVALCQSTTHSDETVEGAGINLTAEAIRWIKTSTSFNTYNIKNDDLQHFSY